LRRESETAIAAAVKIISKKLKISSETTTFVFVGSIQKQYTISLFRRESGIKTPQAIPRGGRYLAAGKCLIFGRWSSASSSASPAASKVRWHRRHEGDSCDNPVAREHDRVECVED
jgi:hypothetical protein